MEGKEKILKDSIRTVSLPMQEEITRQMKKCVCKIHISGGNGTGFFAKIPFKESNIKVLITNNHVLNANDIFDNKLITFSINNDIREIKIGKGRKKYTSVKYDTTIIEVKETDKLENLIEYLEIDYINIKTIKENDKQLSDEHFNNLYKDESLYILNYLGGKDIVISYGFFSKIKESTIYHKCSTDNGSSGAPILSLENNKVIGVHFGFSKNKIKFNLGTLISYPIIEFNLENNGTNKEINPNIINININENTSINSKNYNSMTIRYEDFEEYKKLRLFGEEFVKNNKNNCIIIIDGKNHLLTEYINIDEKMKKNKYIEIQLKEINTITNMSHMFCRGIEGIDKMLVTNIPDISKWDTKNVTDMSYLFCCCELLKSLPDISSWNTSNVKDMSNMISYCGNLESLPDISNWDTRNVTNMSHMFANDFALKQFPDISKWNTSKVKDMEHMFTRCTISEIPDISKWDTSNILNMSYMFSGCRELKTFPNIFKWKIKNRACLRGMFYDGLHIDTLIKYDISNWEINNQCDISFMFYYCDNFYSHNKELICEISNKFKIGLRWIEIWNFDGKYFYF